MATADIPVRRRRSLLRRPSATTGAWSWLSTVDHKRIGILYGYTAFAFFVIGGIEALLIRIQLARPDGTVLSADAYNQIFTTHGLTMIFLVVMPMGAAFMNYLLPLMIGARDVAFPRLNAFSYWIFLFGGIFFYSSVFMPNAGLPDGGWFGYAPLSEQDLVAHNMDYYSLGLQIIGIASLVSAVNFIVTIINMRAPGMSLMRMPVFVWMTFTVAFLLLFAIPVIGIGLFQLTFDRLFGATFYDPAAGGSPILWQHMFWLFGHPEVYILVLPAMGIVSEILPVFSRKPLFGYAAVVFAGVAIGFIGWGVWAHHMFAAGLGPVANSAFALSTMFIAVPTGIKIFNWVGTMWGGSIRFTTPMLFAIGFVAEFIIGGLSGVTHAVVPSDYHQTDTYYIVAHFHYVLFGGAIFGIFAGLYYWFPKLFGRLMNERWGKVHFWLFIVGVNLTFGPMHILGLQGMPRRIYRYADGFGWNMWNLMETVGAFILALGTLVFMINWIVSRRRGQVSAADPWDARTIEWLTTNPPAPHNFDEVPVVHARDEFWHRKYAEDEKGIPVEVIRGGAEDHEPGHEVAHGAHAGEHGGGHGIHMPSPSIYPLVAAAGLPFVGWGLIYRTWWSVGLGILLTFGGLFGWALEPATEPEEAH